MIRIGTFQLADLGELDVHPGQVEASMGARERMVRAVELSRTGRCFTIRRADGIVLMCGGALESHAGLATLWAVFARQAIDNRRLMVAIRGRARLFMARLPHRRVDALVRSDHGEAHRFVHGLHMRVEARLDDYFSDGGDAVVYRYRKPA